MAPLPQHLAKAPVGRERLSREELSRHQRERILAAATEVFAKRGYQASTVDNIVTAAKVGVGSFYAHFEGKQECLLGAYEQIVDSVREQIAVAVAEECSWQCRAMAALQELLALIAARPLAARLALVEIQTGGSLALDRYGETLEPAIAALRGGRDSLGGAPQPPPTLEEATVSGLAWLLAERVVRGEAKEVPELFHQVAEVALEPYFGSAAAQRQIDAFLKSPARP